MPNEAAPDEALVQRLPLPLAQLLRRAHNAKTPLERHLTAFYLWEAGLKLLASTAIVEYARHPSCEPPLVERLQNLARPSLGHWWGFVRLLVPTLAEQGDEAFGTIRDLILGRSRDDFPRAAGLDAVLRKALGVPSGPRTTVRFTELFDRLVSYRNKEMGHGAAGQRGHAFYERMGEALIAGVPEVLGRLDLLAGRRLLYIGEVKQTAGRWQVQRDELIGESARRIESLQTPHAEASRLPFAERVYLSGGLSLEALHPLLLYDAETDEVFFLNARWGRQRTEYLCYATGRTIDRADHGGEQRELLARVLGMEVGEDQASEWSARSHAEETPEAIPERLARRTLGEFELLSELGRGGMGVVYRAWQPSLGRQVALKKMMHGGDAKAESRFAREIRALGRVEHPNLVKVFTSASEGEDWFYAMELIEGTPLSAVCDRLQGRTTTEVDLKTWQEALRTACQESRQTEKLLAGTPPDRLAAPACVVEGPSTAPGLPLSGRGYVEWVAILMRQVAEAAHALHEAGVIHRDVKPGNVMVSPDGSRVVLMDLGLAQLADETEGKLTRTRQFVGTLRYASPEQVLAVGRLDRRSDVYSLGATLWELLTLRPLYGAAADTPTPELMRCIQYKDPERVRKHHPGITRDLEAIVHRCLEKDTDRRYATARELADELGRFLDGRPVLMRPIRAWERGWKWLRRQSRLAVLQALFTSLLLGLCIAGWWYATRATRIRSGTASRAGSLARSCGTSRVFHSKGTTALSRRWPSSPAARSWPRAAWTGPFVSGTSKGESKRARSIATLPSPAWRYRPMGQRWRPGAKTARCDCGARTTGGRASPCGATPTRCGQPPSRRTA